MISTTIDIDVWLHNLQNPPIHVFERVTELFIDEIKKSNIKKFGLNSNIEKLVRNEISLEWNQMDNETIKAIILYELNKYELIHSIGYYAPSIRSWVSAYFEPTFNVSPPKLLITGVLK